MLLDALCSICSAQLPNLSGNSCLSGNARVLPKLRLKGSKGGELRQHEQRPLRFELCIVKVWDQPRSRSDCGLVERVSIVPYRKKAAQWVPSRPPGGSQNEGGG